MAAMKVYDIFAERSNSVEPKDHSPISCDDDSIFANEVKDMVGDIFRSGGCIWCRELIEKRNMCLITVKALINDDDPETYWNEFQKMAAEDKVQYPTFLPD